MLEQKVNQRLTSWAPSKPRYVILIIMAFQSCSLYFSTDQAGRLHLGAPNSNLWSSTISIYTASCLLWTSKLTWLRTKWLHPRRQLLLYFEKMKHTFTWELTPLYWVTFTCLNSCSLPWQGNKAYFNHPMYLSIAIKWFFGNKGITQYFHHCFSPLFPIPGKSLVATMVCVSMNLIILTNIGALRLGPR